jgi:hypothetical protein
MQPQATKAIMLANSAQQPMSSSMASRLDCAPPLLIQSRSAKDNRAAQRRATSWRALDDSRYGDTGKI